MESCLFVQQKNSLEGNPGRKSFSGDALGKRSNPKAEKGIKRSDDSKACFYIRNFACVDRSDNLSLQEILTYLYYQEVSFA